jgi:hypothetical protein
MMGHLSLQIQVHANETITAALMLYAQDLTN